MLKKLSFLLLFTAFILSGCQKIEKKINLNDVIPVKVVKIELRNINETLDYIGDIKAIEEAVVYPKVSGKIIEKVKEDGSPINKGEVIAYIDRDEVGFKFEKAPVESPLTGVIGRVYVDLGQNVNIQTPIALVVDMDKVQINLDIPEKHLSRVLVGQQAKIRVDTYAEEKFTGYISKISPVVNLDTRAAPIEIRLDNPQHRLKSGMFAKVSIIIAKHQNVPVILKEAILGKEPNTYVYIIENKKAVSKNIKLGIRQGPYFEVKEGLEPGDLVVIMGQQKLFNGAEVIAEEDK
jgi:multidrug efflux pump subunit AcrA (membrane-fusion protein)